MTTTRAPVSGALFCCPLPFEAWAVASAPWRRSGLARPRIARTGMGPARAAATAARLRLGEDRSAGADGPSGEASGAVVVAGVAGGIDLSLRHGDVVVADRVLDGDGRAVGSALPSVAALAEALSREGLRVRVGPIITVDRLVSGSPQHRAHLAAKGAVAVDMESAPLVDAVSPGRVAVVRTISDIPGHSLFSPAIIRGGALALSSLRRAAPVAARWAVSGA